MAREIQHGTYTCYVKRKCRLPECRAAAAEQKRRLAARDRELLAQDSAALPHGTKRTYDAGCRCDECKDIGSAAARKHRAKVAAEAGREYRPHAAPHAAKGEIKHGTVSGYCNGGCREECCRRAYAEGRKAWRSNSKPRRRKHREVKPRVASPVKSKVKSQPRKLTIAERRAAYYAEHSERLAALREE